MSLDPAPSFCHFMGPAPLYRVGTRTHLKRKQTTARILERALCHENSQSSSDTGGTFASSRWMRVGELRHRQHDTLPDTGYLQYGEFRRLRRQTDAREISGPRFSALKTTIDYRYGTRRSGAQLRSRGSHEIGAKNLDRRSFWVVRRRLTLSARGAKDISGRKAIVRQTDCLSGAAKKQDGCSSCWPPRLPCSIPTVELK